MKGVLGTTVSDEVVNRFVNVIMDMAKVEDNVTLEVILTAVDEVKKVFATDATMKKRP